MTEPIAIYSLETKRLYASAGFEAQQAWNDYANAEAVAHMRATGESVTEGSGWQPPVTFPEWFIRVYTNGEDLKATMVEPVEDVLYFHSDKESMGGHFRDVMMDAGYRVIDTAEENARRTGYEIEITGVWEKDGTFYATHLCGKELEERVAI